jgi:DNA-binding beta-propeller fold protein YncE
MTIRMTRNRAYGRILLVLLTLATACETQPIRVSPGREAMTTSLTWPQPPLRPRIRYIRTVARPADLGIQPSFWKRLGALIVGAREESFIRPAAVTSGGSAIYIADPGAQGVWFLDTKAGRFERFQEAEGRRLISPVALTLGPNGHLFVSDSFLAKVFVYDTAGHPVGAISTPNLKRPTGLAYDEMRDRLYVADSIEHRIFIFDGKGSVLGTIGQRGVADGEFNSPTHLAVDREGNLYVTDALGFRVQFFSPNGAFAGQFGTHGDASGDFAMPKGVAVDSRGHIYVVDALFDAVQIFDRRGQLLLAFGGRGTGPGEFWLPNGLFIDSQDRIYVADSYNQRIQIFEYVGGDEP